MGTKNSFLCVLLGGEAAAEERRNQDNVCMRAWRNLQYSTVPRFLPPPLSIHPAFYNFLISTSITPAGIQREEGAERGAAETRLKPSSP